MILYLGAVVGFLGELFVHCLKGYLAKDLVAWGELENLVQNLEELMDQATGDKDELPWEKGGQQFNQVQLPQNISNLFVPNTGSEQ